MGTRNRSREWQPALTGLFLFISVIALGLAGAIVLVETLDRLLP